MNSPDPKITDVLWLTGLSGSYGIVKVDSIPEPKFYIGTINGNTSKNEDMNYIARLGAPISPWKVKEFFGL